MEYDTQYVMLNIYIADVDYTDLTVQVTVILTRVEVSSGKCIDQPP